MDNAGSLQAVGSLGVAGEDGIFTSRMTGAFGDFKLGADLATGQDRGRSLRVSTRSLVVGPAAKAKAMGLASGHVPQPPASSPPDRAEPVAVETRDPEGLAMMQTT